MLNGSDVRSIVCIVTKAFCFALAVSALADSAKAQAIAQDEKACSALLSAGLVNQTSETVNMSEASKDFDSFCSEDSNYSSRFSGKSQAFQASFSYAGFGVGGGSADASQSASTDEAFRKICRERKNEFVKNFSRSFASRDGSYVAERFNQCIEILTKAGNSLLWGQILRPESVSKDNNFILLLQYTRSRKGDDPELEVASLATVPTSVRCYTASEMTKDAIKTNAELRGTLVLTCTKPDSADVSGVITVRTKGKKNQLDPVKFTVSAKTLPTDLARNLESQIKALESDVKKRNFSSCKQVRCRGAVKELGGFKEFERSASTVANRCSCEKPNFMRVRAATCIAKEPGSNRHFVAVWGPAGDQADVPDHIECSAEEPVEAYLLCCDH